jgi:hypothetical protein
MEELNNCLAFSVIRDSRSWGEGGERGAICADFEDSVGGTGGEGGFRESSIRKHDLYT